jgi:hypothetical protein
MGGRLAGSFIIVNKHHPNSLYSALLLTRSHRILCSEVVHFLSTRDHQLDSAVGQFIYIFLDQVANKITVIIID